MPESMTSNIDWSSIGRSNITRRDIYICLLSIALRISLNSITFKDDILHFTSRGSSHIFNCQSQTIIGNYYFFEEIFNINKQMFIVYFDKWSRTLEIKTCYFELYKFLVSCVKVNVDICTNPYGTNVIYLYSNHFWFMNICYLSVYVHIELYMNIISNICLHLCF